MAKKPIDQFFDGLSTPKKIDVLSLFAKPSDIRGTSIIRGTSYTSKPKAKKMDTLQKTTGLVKVDRPQVPRNAVAIYDDSKRYKFGFGVASQSSGTIYKISFDAASGALYWKCSCNGCKSHGQCKHLNACGLQGRNSGKQISFAKKYGLI